jgi:hypothetical protein
MLPVLGTLVFGSALTAAWLKAKPRAQAQATPTTQWILGRVLDAKLPPDEYRRMAKGFEQHGFHAEGKVLRARAAYGELPQAVRDQHKAIVQQALLSDNVPVIRQIADNLYDQGAVANATRLRRHAAAVEAAAAIAPVSAPMPDPEPTEPEAEVPATTEELTPTDVTQADTPTQGEEARAADPDPPSPREAAA